MTLYDLLDEASKADPLASSYRVAFVAAKSVEELAAATGETPSEILDRLNRRRTLAVALRIPSSRQLRSFELLLALFLGEAVPEDADWHRDHEKDDDANDVLHI